MTTEVLLLTVPTKPSLRDDSVTTARMSCELPASPPAIYFFPAESSESIEQRQSPSQSAEPQDPRTQSSSCFKPPSLGGKLRHAAVCNWGETILAFLGQMLLDHHAELLIHCSVLMGNQNILFLFMKWETGPFFKVTDTSTQVTQKWTHLKQNLLPASKCLTYGSCHCRRGKEGLGWVGKQAVNILSTNPEGAIRHCQRKRATGLQLTLK